MPILRGVRLQRELANYPPTFLSPVRARLRRGALDLIEREGLEGTAAYSYNIVPLDAPAGETLHAGGEILSAPALVPESGELTALGFGAATLGTAIEVRIGELFAEKRASLAIALDELSVEMLLVLGRRIQDRMLSEALRERLTMAGELSAGDPGLDLAAQKTVLRLSGGEKIGISLTDGLMMGPTKSVTMVFGVGKYLPAVRWSRCDYCPSGGKCNFGRYADQHATVSKRLP